MRRETGMRWDIHPVRGNGQQWLRILMEILKIHFKCFLHGKIRSRTFHTSLLAWFFHFLPVILTWCFFFFLSLFCQVVFFLTKVKEKEPPTSCGYSLKFLCRQNLTGCGFIRSPRSSQTHNTYTWTLHIYPLNFKNPVSCKWKPWFPRLLFLLWALQKWS